MIQEELFTRNGKSFKALTGIDPATGEAPNLIIPTDAHKRTSQKYDLVLSEIKISCDTTKRGNPVAMEATWIQRQYDNAGNIIASYNHTESHVLTPAEVAEFTAGFLPLLQPSIYNGAIRGGKNADSVLLGHNEQPLFGADGARIPDTSYDVQAAPTYTYSPDPIV